MLRSLRLSAALAAAALLLLPAPAARAAGIGAFAGVMDTDLLEDSPVYGGQLEFDFFPCVSLLIRGGYADGFDDLEIKGPAGTLRAEEISLVPVEAGLLLRPPALFGILGIYAGGGAGWYCLPGFDVYAGKNRIAETDDVTDLVGWWALGGIELGVPSFRVFGEVKYMGAEKDGIDIEFRDVRDKGNLKADVDLSGVAFLVGVRVAW